MKSQLNVGKLGLWVKVRVSVRTPAASLLTKLWRICVMYHVLSGCSPVTLHSLTHAGVALVDVSWCELSSFLQIDIIGAMLIVWRVRGKIISSVLCSIVCNSCTHIWTELTVVCWLVLAFLWLYWCYSLFVLDLAFWDSFVLYFVSVFALFRVTVIFFSNVPRDWLARTSRHELFCVKCDVKP